MLTTLDIVIADNLDRMDLYSGSNGRYEGRPCCSLRSAVVRGKRWQVNRTALGNLWQIFRLKARQSY